MREAAIMVEHSEAVEHIERVNIVNAAIAWWHARRPDWWTERQHLDNPLINCQGDRATERLARCVAAYVAEERKHRENMTLP